MSSSKNNNTLSVAAIVVTWNRADNALRWIESIKKQTYPVNEIIVVDNGSNDNTVDIINRKHPDVSVVEVGKNTGHAGGAMKGIEKALCSGHDWFWMFDDDAFPYSNALEITIDALSIIEDNNPALLYSPSSNSAGWYWKGYKIPVHFTEKDTDNGTPIKVQQVDFNMTLVSKNAVERIGLPDGSYFMMGWEIEYCMRFIKHGYTCWVVPQILVSHEHAGYKSQSTWRAFYQSRNHVLTTIKYPSISNILWCIYRQTRFIASSFIRLPANRTILMMRLYGIMNGIFRNKGKLIDPDKYN